MPQTPNLQCQPVVGERHCTAARLPSLHGVVHFWWWSEWGFLQLLTTLSFVYPPPYRVRLYKHPNSKSLIYLIYFLRGRTEGFPIPRLALTQLLAGQSRMRFIMPKCNIRTNLNMNSALWTPSMLLKKRGHFWDTIQEPTEKQTLPPLLRTCNFFYTCFDTTNFLTSHVTLFK